VIADRLGRQQLFAGKTDTALATLDLALDEASRTTQIDALELATTLRAAAVAAARLHLSKAGDFSRDAVRTIREDASLPEIELIRNLGEAALVAYFVRDLPSSYGYLCEAGERYLARRVEGEQLGNLPCALGQVIEHVYYVATTGEPPDPAKLNIEIIEPQPDIFYRNKPAITIVPEVRLITCIRLASIAEQVGRDDDSVDWALRACAEAYENPTEKTSRWIFVALQYVAASASEDALDIFCRELSAAAGIADDRYQQALLIALWFWLLRLARDSEANPDAALASATRLAAQCRMFASTTRHEASWLSAAEFISSAARGGSERSIVNTSNELIAKNDEVMGLVARAAALLAQDLDLRTAVRLQMAVLKGYAGTSLVFTRRVIHRYIETYWAKVAARQGFLLVRPKSLREGISRAAQLGPWDACIAILESAADALGVITAPGWSSAGPEKG
jgi:hypothetical protein